MDLVARALSPSTPARSLVPSPVSSNRRSRQPFRLDEGLALGFSALAHSVNLPLLRGLRALVSLSLLDPRPGAIRTL